MIQVIEGEDTDVEVKTRMPDEGKTRWNAQRQVRHSNMRINSPTHDSRDPYHYCNTHKYLDTRMKVINKIGGQNKDSKSQDPIKEYEREKNR